MASSGTLNLRSTWNKKMSEIKNMHPYGLNVLCYSPMVQVMSQQDIKHNDNIFLCFGAHIYQENPFAT
jgi:hypothetical protein